MSKELENLINIVQRLRSEDGCEWDKKQTSESLTPHLLEEANEVVDAILENNPENLKEELGDLLLHIVFQATIASEKKLFDFDELAKKINEKLVDRHPHIFDENFNGEDQSKAKNWELNKKIEKNRQSILDGMPKSLSSLIVSQRYQDKTAAVGFEWDNYEQAMYKVEEELNELKIAIKNDDKKNIEEEIGDLLITIVNLSRFFSISAELALKKSNQKFYKRFNYIEKIVEKNNQKMEDISLKELLNYWNDAKDKEK
tara:strand:- start:404 stop:1174 length:771 start_codon:yes stop_codon:yes gene_type:complete